MATDSNRPDLNHPYAYAYAIPVAAPNNPDFSVRSQNVDAQLNPKSSYVSTLVSAGVHAVILVTGALIFATVPRSPAIEIVMTKAPVASQQPVETFVMDSQPDAPETDEAPPSADIPQSKFQIAELSLAANIDVGKATEAKAAGPAETAKDGNSGRGSEFFGMAAYGDKFVYVMDVSGSMAQRSQLNDYDHELSPSTNQKQRLHLASIRRRAHTRFEVAERELLRSINQLEEDQWFCVMLFNSETHPMFEQTPRLIAATQANKDRIREWMAESGPGGGTDPTGGLRRGFEMQPDAVFLLSDGEFTSGYAAEKVVQRNLHREIPLHTIAFESPSSRRRLRSMSEISNGRHRYVGSQTRQELIAFDVRSGGREANEALQQIIDGSVPLGVKERADLGIECCRLLLTGPRVTSRLAHECMLAMADGKDFGPANRGKRQVVLRSARKWRQYWKQLPK